MIQLEAHHLRRIDQLSAHTGEPDVEIVARMIVDLGAMPRPHAITGWIWEALIEAGLEETSAHKDSAAGVAAWESIEAAQLPLGR